MWLYLWSRAIGKADTVASTQIIVHEIRRVRVHATIAVPNLGELDHEDHIAVAIMAIERPALVPFQQRVVRNDLGAVLAQMVVAPLQIIHDEAEVMPAGGDA